MIHSSASLETIINATRTEMWDWDLLADRMIHSNQLELIAGYNEGELPTDESLARDILISKEDQSRLNELVQACRCGKIDSYVTEFRIKCKNGSIKWVQERGAVAARDESGEATRLVGMFYAVDHFNQAESSMNEKVRLLDFAAGLSGMGCLDWNLPKNQLHFDMGFLKLFGYSPDMATLNYQKLKTFIHPEDFAEMTQALNDYLYGKTASFSQQIRIRHNDGYYIWILASARIVEWDTNGIPVRVFASILNVDRLVRAEIKAKSDLLYQDKYLRAANAVAAVLIESSPESFDKTLLYSLELLGKALDVDRVYVWRNAVENDRLVASELCEWLKDGSTGYLEYGERKFAYEELVPEWKELIDTHSCINGKVSELGGAISRFPGFTDVKSVLLIPVTAQKEFWGALGFDNCHDPDRVFKAGEVQIMQSCGILIASAHLRHKMTQNLIEAKETAQKASQAKSDFLSRMSHEIRTPMNAIIGMTAIACKSDKKENIYSCLDKIDNASKQLLALINDILDMSKIEANKLEITPSEFDFEQMVRNVCSVLNSKITEKQLELSVDFENLCTRKIICDELRLSQVMTNLLSNSVKFTPEGGSIIVKIRHYKNKDGINYLRIETKDSGIGISPDQQARLFNAFEQADSSTTRKYGGTGLGLAICKRIVHLMGGEIWVESELGQGSNFIFEARFDWGSDLKETLPKVPKNDIRVLVVDDLQDTLIYFQNILSGFSIYCDTIDNGSDAIALVNAAKERGRPYDVIFLDWQMPGMDGMETAAHMLKLIDSRTRIVMISVADWSEVSKELADIGITDFLPKPVFPSILYNTLVSLTDNTLVSGKEDQADNTYDWHTRRILLVEDIQINQEIIQSILEDTGVKIDCVWDGVEAVEAWEKQGEVYDLILMDMQMPRMDGLEATRRIRSSGSAGADNTPIIAMTANALKEDVDKCLAAGVNDHIAKPVDIDNLFIVLAEYLNE